MERYYYLLSNGYHCISCDRYFTITFVQTLMDRYYYLLSNGYHCISCDRYFLKYTRYYVISRLFMKKKKL